MLIVELLPPSPSPHLPFVFIGQDREELFAYLINWQVVETQGIIQAKMRPWIVKKIIEYLGEEEKTLTEFILTKLGQRASPQVSFLIIYFDLVMCSFGDQ